MPRRAAWVVALLAVAARGQAGAAPAPSALGRAVAVVVRSVTVRETAALEFGWLSTAARESGAVIVGPGGARYLGGVRGLADAGAAPPHPADFRIEGEPGHAYWVAAPAAIRITGSTVAGALAAPLVVSELTVVTRSRPAAGGHGLLAADGSDRFALGGRLDVPGGLPGARYRASVPVVVSYE